MDNLYNSAKFFRYLYSMPQKIMGHGVTRLNGRGVPACVMQKEFTSKAMAEKVRHTVKVAVVKGDSVCGTNPLVCISLYDTKPVYVMTTAISEIKWTAKKRKVWHKGKNQYVTIKFLRLNVIDFYNLHMGSVDLADQLRNQYRYDTQWHRNRKWWWAVWWWGFQLLLTNAYKLYCDFHKEHNSTAALSHYDFIKSIALAWLDRERYWPMEARKRTRSQVAGGVQIRNDTAKRTRACSSRRSLSSSSSSSSGEWCSIASSSSAESQGRKRDSTVTVLAASVSSTAATSLRNITMNENALHPNGVLKCRLNGYLNHYPGPSHSKRAKCQLHRWARGRDGVEVRGKKVVHCSGCNVDLCFKCWRTFHQCTDVVSLKDEIAKSAPWK